MVPPPSWPVMERVINPTLGHLVMLFCCIAGVRNWHEAAVRKCALLRRLWGLSGHQSASSIYEYTPLIDDGGSRDGPSQHS